MTYKCPFCGYTDSLVSFSAQLEGDVQCRHCCLSTSNALLRAQEDLINQFTAYTISHSDLQRQAVVKAPVKHIPFASSAAHSIYIPPYRPSPQEHTTSEAGRESEMQANGNSSHQECSSFDSLPDSQMDCLPESELTSRHTGMNIPAATVPVGAPDHSHEIDLVEPYMVLGYEEEQRSEQSWKSQEQPQDLQPSKPAYSPYNDPVFNSRQWWEFGGSGKVDYPYRASEDTMMAGLS
ncbi:hypothetical protein PISL3812_04923 [Talaromyces islandicus]|uniref:Uncharacterized protein n=1 Tax=Talaromyces islandicus TaxID=28573 RepID=A0A0U1LYX0_TALIS|nr:hypothetical protein PISL3812_04923 [Talaromyces islandicus]